MKDGVNFSLSSDDPGLLNSSLLRDYAISKTQFGFSTKQLQALVSCFLRFTDT